MDIKENTEIDQFNKWYNIFFYYTTKKIKRKNSCKLLPTTTATNLTLASNIIRNEEK